MKSINEGWLYFRFEVLPEEIKQIHKIRSNKRLDCTSFYSNNGMRGFDSCVGSKNQMFVYIQDRRVVVNSKRKVHANYALTHGSLNITSLIGDVNGKPQYAYGYPYNRRFTSSNTPNPFYAYKDDLYLLFIDEEYQWIEFLIIPGARNSYMDYFHCFLAGKFDNDLEQLRENSKPFFDYGL